MPRCGGTQPQPKKDTQLTKNKLQSQDVISKVCEIVKNDLNKTNLTLDNLDFIKNYDT